MRRAWMEKAVLAAMMIVIMVLPGRAEPPKMKMSTKVPQGIEMPDKVETRLGTLKFFDGFPDDATVGKLYDNLDFQNAVQAYMLGLAPVNQAANRKGILEVGPANTTVPIFETMMNARSIFLTPNNNTPYTWFWLDLSKGPLHFEMGGQNVLEGIQIPVIPSCIRGAGDIQVAPVIGQYQTIIFHRLKNNLVRRGISGNIKVGFKPESRPHGRITRIG